mgnify:CR=1 FL=1|tara:strand:+ start:563 stop:685 length:123 start_codon:yes stop_codon:yes gene_type:complete
MNNQDLIKILYDLKKRLEIIKSSLNSISEWLDLIIDNKEN